MTRFPFASVPKETRTSHVRSPRAVTVPRGRLAFRDMLRLPPICLARRAEYSPLLTLIWCTSGALAMAKRWFTVFYVVTVGLFIRRSIDAPAACTGYQF